MRKRTTAVLVAAFFILSATPAAANQTATPPTCGGFVSAHTYNDLLRKQRQLTGHRPVARTKPVTKCAYLERKKIVKQARRTCKANAHRATFSTFGTSAGDDNGIGYQGDILHEYNDSYAELSTPGTLDFAAMGGLRYLAVRYFEFHGRWVRGVKRDVGQGGAGLEGTDREADLHAPLANRLRFSGLGVGRISRFNCWG